MLSKINVFNIVKSHFTTLKNANTQKADKGDYFVFLLIPILITAILLYYGILLKTDEINIIISTLSILVGLLFNVIVLIFDIVKRDKKDDIKNTVLKELLSNIAFTILLSIFSIVVTLFTYIDNPIVKYISNGLVFFLLTNFAVTVLMVLKRMFVIFQKEIEDTINE